jgi:tripeptidyl-peptidase I
MVQLSLATLTLLSASASLYTAGVHAQKRTTLLQKRDSAPDGFTHCGSPSDDHTLDIHLALAANDITGLQRKLEAISDPASPLFRQWLSKEEASTRFHIMRNLKTWLTLH